MWKSSNNVNWQNVGFTSRNTIANWVELTGINSFSRWTLSSPGNALPLSWNSFAAVCNDNKVTVSWKTLQELNTLSFEIQKSSNGIAWNTIGTIAAAGTSNAALNYHFDDLQPGSAITFYRILQKDIDGQSSYSPVLRTNCSGKDDLKIFPTVTNDIITILNPATTPIQKVQVRIMDFSGKTVLVKEMQGQANQLSLQHLAAGMYSVEIKSGEIIKRVKIVRQ